MDDEWTSVAVRVDTHQKLEDDKKVVERRGRKKLESYDDVIRRKCGWPVIEDEKGDKKD